MFEVAMSRRSRTPPPRAAASADPASHATRAWPSSSTSATPRSGGSSPPSGTGDGWSRTPRRPASSPPRTRLRRRGGALAERPRPPRSGRLCSPRDPADDRDAILEVKSGEGGGESALFAGDLLRMYTRYAERRGWQRGPRRRQSTWAMQSVDGGQGQGRRDPARRRTACSSSRRRAPGAAGAGDRVAGRIHTRRRRPGAAGGRGGRRDHRPERPAHRRLPQRRPGGQSVNTTDSRSGSPTCPPASW